eukprot:CAMPEP_0172844638 /NCGR_PEP_ID=MMETSP1075-20121228/32374_1 /TAXON_ID=2916 /ORGANISM="Ceratium fusus, Strain PA161109" /LENGTH=68 /DNA_ID=CAMNT_0013689121 /DNA_START=227 /DNA_END=430 /DNA_ORIENTATION=-
MSCKAPAIFSEGVAASAVECISSVYPRCRSTVETALGGGSGVSSTSKPGTPWHLSGASANAETLETCK